MFELRVDFASDKLSEKSQMFFDLRTPSQCRGTGVSPLHELIARDGWLECLEELCKCWDLKL